MRINGVGNVRKEDVLKVLSEDGKKSLIDGTITMEEAAAMYKMQLVKKHSVIGNITDTFYKNYERIPEGLSEKLSPEEIANLVDAFYYCYGEGKNANKG